MTGLRTQYQSPRRGGARILRPTVIAVVGLLLLGKASPLAYSQDAAGIKNLEGADVELMHNHDPASELANFQVLDGYQVNLFAADPMLANPVHMHWDSRGRLWVACSWAYPQLKPGEVPNDKIIILEDTDQDGVADKSTVFADGLYVPTGLELANGGCYVAQSPDVFFFKDTDGDDVADVKQIALTGFGIEDSHHSVSAWRRGPDGWLYFQEGIFLHTQVETQHGVVRNFDGGVYQFNPRTQELRVFCSGTGGNPWGHVFDDWGQSFMVNNPRIMYLTPATGNSGQKIRLQPLISTEKQCGGDLATGTHVAEDIRGNLLSGRFKSRAIIRYEFIEDGAGYTAHVLPPLLTCTHPNFRPVDVKMGPDGAIYVADWYNSIINHAQHDFRDPRRDHEHGRIWRISHKQRPLVVQPQLVDAPVSELVKQLASPEAWTRHQARKELSEQDADSVLAAVEAWVAQLDPRLPEYDHCLVEAMWACQNVERPSHAILERVLAAQDGRARAAGARILRYWYAALPDPIGMLAQVCDDEFPRARMEGVLSAGFVPQAAAFAAALHVLDHPGDRFLDLALPQTQQALEKYWRPALEAGELQFASAAHRQYALRSAGIGFSQQLAEFLSQPAPEPAEITRLAGQLKSLGTEADIRLVIDALVAPSPPRTAEASVALLQAVQHLAARFPESHLRQPLQGLQTLLHHDDPEVAALAASTLGAWRVTSLMPVLVQLVQEETRPAVVRRSAALALTRLGTPEAREQLLTLAQQGSLETRYAALVGVVSGDVARGVELAAPLLASDPQQSDPVPLIQNVLQQRQGAALLATALKSISVDSRVAERIAAFHRASGAVPDELLDACGLATAQGSLSQQLLNEELETLAQDVDRFGDAVRGERLYRREAVACGKCHAIGPVGPHVGPNLVAVGAAAKTSYVVLSILAPNAAIAEHYENRTFMMQDGTLRTGIVSFRSDDEVVILDPTAAGRELHLPADEIIGEKVTVSAMPAGLADQLASRQDFLDLAKFVSALGKPGPFANDERPVIRLWELRGGEAPPLDEATESCPPEGWTVAYSLVNGTLPESDFPDGRHVMARSRFSVQVAGELQLLINDNRGLRVWLDGQELTDPSAPFACGLGEHRLTIAIDCQQRGNRVGLRVELTTPAASAAKFQLN